MHRAVAKAGGGPILEIGAGTLNHVPFEQSVDAYDVVEPFHTLWEDSPARSRVRTYYDDLGDVPNDLRYGRIISVAVLEHLDNLPWVIARSATMLSPGGLFQAGFPSEDGLLWGLSWRLTTGIAYRLRTGLDYAVVMHHEHLNSAREIITLVEYFFSEVQLSRFPLPFHHLSFYAAVSAREPRLDRCQSFLSEHPRISIKDRVTT
jgi:2-polyprenyl-3-methyl-5-hydroxy-6-metoxy-1,4-benzoquinol methylase